MIISRVRYNWLNTNVPQIFGDGWRCRLDNLSDYEISNLRMNRSGLVHYRRIIADRLLRTNEMNPGLIHDRLTTLLRRLESELPADYISELPEGW